VAVERARALVRLDDVLDDPRDRHRRQAHPHQPQHHRAPRTGEAVPQHRPSPHTSEQAERWGEVLRRPGRPPVRVQVHRCRQKGQYQRTDQQPQQRAPASSQVYHAYHDQQKSHHARRRRPSHRVGHHPPQVHVHEPQQELPGIQQRRKGARPHVDLREPGRRDRVRMPVDHVHPRETPGANRREDQPADQRRRRLPFPNHAVPQQQRHRTRDEHRRVRTPRRQPRRRRQCHPPHRRSGPFIHRPAQRHQPHRHQQIERVRFDFGSVADGVVRAGQQADREERFPRLHHTPRKSREQQQSAGAREHRHQPQRPLRVAQQPRRRQLDPHEHQRNDLPVQQRLEHARVVTLEKVDRDERLVTPHRKPHRVSHDAPREPQQDQQQEKIAQPHGTQGGCPPKRGPVRRQRLPNAGRRPPLGYSGGAAA